jgi:hypothetical protein
MNVNRAKEQLLKDAFAGPSEQDHYQEAANQSIITFAGLVIAFFWKSAQPWPLVLVTAYTLWCLVRAVKDMSNYLARKKNRNTQLRRA